MSILMNDDRNIIEADSLNWRLIVYPIVFVALTLLTGFGIYYYQLNQRELQETQAREALALAKTPEEMVKVADQYPRTIQASVALLSAGDASFTARDYTGAAQDYQRVASAKKAPPELRDSARIGLGASLEAAGKSEDAIRTYLEIAQKRNHSPFSPAAYYAVAQIYASRQDKANEQRTLEQTVQLGSDSPFVKDAATQLKAFAPAPAETPGASPTSGAPNKPQP
jgi:tetratricopeptide (TPR) repeat protein